jgi:hypothetical protein
MANAIGQLFILDGNGRGAFVHSSEILAIVSIDRLHSTDHGAYQVAVTGLQGLVDGFADLTGGGLPGTKAQLAVLAR